MKKALIILAVLILAAPAMAQTMYNFDQKIFAWDAAPPPNCVCPTPPCTPTAICPGPTFPSPMVGQMKYQVWSKATVQATTGTKVGGEITATQLNMTFPPYSAVFPGVQAVFYPAATPTSAADDGVYYLFSA